MKYTTGSVDETRMLGKRFSAHVKPGDVIVLDGGLGCGKTEFVRGLVEAFDQSIIVRSPSFSIVNTYAIRHMPLYHFDFYRLEKAAELNEIGFDEYVNGSGACIIEWGLMFPEVLPSYTTVIKFCDLGDSKRSVELPFDI